jgi:hypothetical protein
MHDVALVGIGDVSRRQEEGFNANVRKWSCAGRVFRIKLWLRIGFINAFGGAKPDIGVSPGVCTTSDVFAYICTYLRTFALKTFFFPSRNVLIPTEATSCISKMPNKTFDLQTRTAEVQQQTHVKTGCLEVVHALGTMDIF